MDVLLWTFCYRRFSMDVLLWTFCYGRFAMDVLLWMFCSSTSFVPLCQFQFFFEIYLRPLFYVWWQLIAKIAIFIIAYCVYNS